jgi:hypothetical protein
MVVGIDVWHSKNRGEKSVAAIVCSLNATYSRWHSSSIKQTAQTELLDGLRVNMK